MDTTAALIKRLTAERDAAYRRGLEDAAALAEQYATELEQHHSSAPCFVLAVAEAIRARIEQGDLPTA